MESGRGTRGEGHQGVFALGLCHSVLFEDEVVPPCLSWRIISTMLQEYLISLLGPLELVLCKRFSCKSRVPVRVPFEGAFMKCLS